MKLRHSIKKNNIGSNMFLLLFIAITIIYVIFYTEYFVFPIIFLVGNLLLWYPGLIKRVEIYVLEDGNTLVVRNVFKRVHTINDVSLIKITTYKGERFLTIKKESHIENTYDDIILLEDKYKVSLEIIYDYIKSETNN